MNVAVIGAGPAGLTAAYRLRRKVRTVDVFEAGDSVGGLARSLRIWGQTVDVGPHRFFSRDPRVNALWLEVVGSDYAMVRRLTRILYQRQFYQYPLQARDALVKLGAVEALSCVASYVKAWAGKSGTGFQHVSKLNGKSDDRLEACPTLGDSFENWVCERFGRRLFEIFFKSYSEKLWGIPCSELDADFAAQRIKQFSLGAAIKSAFTRSGSEHRTLVDEFAYPAGGTGMVYERMVRGVVERGGQVFLNTPARRVLTERDQVKGVELADGTVREYDHVISTMPLTLLVERLPETPPNVLDAARQLTFRNTILVYLEVANRAVCPDQWIYVHSPELRTGRITNFRNWVPQLYGDSPNTILAMEYWCDNRGKDKGGEHSTLNIQHSTFNLWGSSDEDLIALARRELLATTLVREEGQILNSKVIRIPRCYPVYRRGYKELLRPIREYVSSIRGLQAIGRYGAFKYNNQDHSILMGILAAENLLENAGHDLWGVNADYDTYQEGWKITETGLVPAGHDDHRLHQQFFGSETGNESGNPFSVPFCCVDPCEMINLCLPANEETIRF